jgi:hypothetical protein
MMIMLAHLIFLSIFCKSVIYATHVRGGFITYIPLTDHGTHVTVQFTSKWAYRWSFFGGTNVGSWINPGGSIMCRVGCGTAWSPSSIGGADFIATTVSSVDDWIQGEKTWTADLPKVQLYRASWACGGCWIALNTPGINAEVSVALNTLNRPDGKINTAPVSSIAAIVRMRRGVTTQLTVPWSDADADTVRCRTPITTQNECGSICDLLPGATLNSNTCTFTFDTNFLGTGFYGVSVMLEDFITPSSTIPLSGIVVQFLVFVCGGSSTCAFPQFFSDSYCKIIIFFCFIIDQ